MNGPRNQDPSGARVSPTDPPSKQVSDADEIGSRYLRENIGPVLDFVQHQGKPLVVTRHGRRSVAIVPLDWGGLDAGQCETRSGDLPAHNGR